MKTLTTLGLSIFLCLPLTMFAQHLHTDTLGMKISREHTITQTTTFIEQIVDSIGSFTYDTVKKVDTIQKVDTSYLIHQRDLYWQLGSNFEIGVNQVARSNWAAGGGNSYSILFSNKSNAYYTRGNLSWKTDLDWKYGFQQQEGTPWFKNYDLLEINSIFGFKASNAWYYSGLFNLKTQLAKGYASATDDAANFVSRFFSPARSTFSLGMEYNNTPKTVYLFLSPVAYRLTYVWDTALSPRYSVPVGEHFLTTFGPMAMLTNKHQLTKDVALNSTLNVFANLLEMDAPFVTVEWKLNVSYQITKYLSFSFETYLISDPTAKFARINPDGTTSMVRKVQFQEIMGLKLTYKIAN